MSILIVEDNELDQKIVDLNLRKHNFDTILKNSVKEALDYLSTDKDVHLVITDIMMAEMDGIELLQKMKENEELKEIPVIICSALKDMETVKETVQLGAVDYIVKPIRANVLLEKVRKALGSNKNAHIEEGLPVF